MWAGTRTRAWIATLLAVTITSSVASRTLAQTAPTQAAPPSTPAATEGPPPPPPSYAVPPPPPPAASRYPAAPDLTPPAAGPGDMVAPEAEVAPQLRIPAHIGTRLRVLSTDINTLGARGGGGIADGIFSIITGGVLIALGVLLEPASTSESQLSLSPQLYVFGASSIGRGLIELVVVPNPYSVMLEYSHMPMTSVAEVKHRLRYGEGALEELASRNRLARLLDGALSLGAGATLAGLTISANSNANASVDEGTKTAFLLIGLLGATTLAIGGAISLLSSTDAEQRWEAYQGLRERLSRERALSREQTQREQHQPAPTSPTVTRITPVITPGLAMGMLTVTF